MWLLTLLCTIPFVISCGFLLTDQPADETLLDGPIDGLTSSQVALHVMGDHEFNHVSSPAEGLGPIFNAQACLSCHLFDGRGHSSTTLLRFGRPTPSGFDPLIEFGGPQLQEKAVSGFTPEFLPAEAAVMARFLPPAVTGMGYLEAIDDASILALEDPNDRDGDGISGVASRVVAPSFVEVQAHRRRFGDTALGRFGRKAGAIDLLHQTVNAFINDMGLTSDFHLEDLVNKQQGNHTGDVISDPEVSGARVRSIVWYLRTLKAPPRRNIQDPVVTNGERVFATVGCGGCHTATFTTAPSDVAALSRVVIHPYTDLLLHDMGDELNDGYTEGSAAPAEWRTTPLWGLGLSGHSTGNNPRFLHDGRAKTIEEAIRLHGGEGSASRAKFQQLSDSDRSALLRFLESL